MTEPLKTVNAITRRLENLQLLWSDFTQSTTASCCCWYVEQEELTMIDTFYQVNADESSDTPDIFLRLESPFIEPKQYTKTLSKELATLVDADRAGLAEDNIFIDWQPKHKVDPNNSAVGFLHDFFHLADSLDLEEGKVVIFLLPSAISSPAKWQKWWSDVLSLNIPDKIALMVCDTKENELLQAVKKKFPNKLMVFSPALDMPNAIRELMSEYGDQEDGCTHFRKAYFELTQAVGKQDVNAIRDTAKIALTLARQIGFPHLEITVLCTAGNGFMLNGKSKAGITAFDEALKIANASKDKPLVAEFPDMKVDLPGGNLFEQLSVQILFFKGAGFLSMKKTAYEQALKSYEQAEKQLAKMLLEKKATSPASDWTNGGIIHFHLLEALRMRGYCSERLGRKQQALKIYAKAVSVAEKMSPEMRTSTTLPFIGQALLNICHKQGMKKEYWRVQEKMDNLLGKDWEKQLPKAA